MCHILHILNNYPMLFYKVNERGNRLSPGIRR
jgi:hypothetical protein